ncbi:enoyl-CoA hydratase-related protein [Caballeronia sp. dw_19]|uniref:enoyl-CoA hydratase/isomerase family protein n=1 Tax=Caballeronia sp. dw_19 TaxID=2719791 RepID=UPI001BD40A23
MALTPDGADGFIEVTDRDRARHVILQRETRANALSITMLNALTHAITSASGSSEIDAIVLSAAGAANFCSGADMAELKMRASEQYAALRDLIAALDERRLPLICVLHGKTLGAGCLLPALSDVVIASSGAVLGFPEMRFGMYPALIHAVLAQKLPPSLVYAICVGARVLSARDAWSLGLVTELLDADVFEETARERAGFYVTRSAAILHGREMTQASAGEALPVRVARAEGIIGRNLAEPEVAAMLAGYRK